MHSTDIALVQRARQGCHVSFEVIYNTYNTPIYRYLAGMLRDASLAEDLCQETFTSAYRNMSSLQDEAQLSSWLFRIATNKAISALRRRKLIAWVPFDISFHDQTTRRDVAEDVVSDDAAARALARLPRDHVICLLGHAEGLSYADLARVLRCTLPAVKQRLYRARIAFRTAYATESQLGETAVAMRKSLGS